MKKKENIQKAAGQKPTSGAAAEGQGFRLFGRTNIWMMVGCVLMIIVGFALMAGPGSTVEGGFNPDIFSTRRIVVGPTIAFLGFLLMAFAIIYKPKAKSEA